MKKRSIRWICLLAVLLIILVFSLLLLQKKEKYDRNNQSANAENEEEASAEFSKTDFSILNEPNDTDITQVLSDLQEISKLCREYYDSAEKIPSENNNTGCVISQSDIDAMENALIEAGYCTVNSDAEYPEYLENSELLEWFWDEVRHDQNAKTAVWSIKENGAVACCAFHISDGLGYCIHATGEWDDSSGEISLSFFEKREIQYWNMTENGFIYQDVCLDSHWDAAHFLRLQSVDHERDALVRKYISSIGYHNANIFLLDWDSKEFGDICFNDLFSGLYYQKYGEELSADAFLSSDEPYHHCLIPAELFESVVFEHFDISLEKFRDMALYDTDSSSYPWQEINCGNVLYYPEVIPEVIQIVYNPDGTVTLLINVICPDRHTDSLFQHEVTLKIGPDGEYLYLSNRIIYCSGIELPSSQKRSEVQRY